MQGNVLHRDKMQENVVHSITERGNGAEKVPRANIPEQHPQQDAEVEENYGMTPNEEREIPRSSRERKKQSRIHIFTTRLIRMDEKMSNS